MAKRKRGNPSVEAIALYADSERDADQLHFSGFGVPDPFVALGIGGRRIGVLNALEFGRALKESSLDEVLPLEDWQERAKRRLRVERAGPAEVIVTVARDRRARRVRVAPGFPVGIARRIEALGLPVVVAEGALLPEREVKGEAEVRAIVEGNRCSALGLRVAEDLLRRAVARGRRLLLEGRALTSERVREAIEIACLRAGAVSHNTIVAGGDQACDPHCRGSGPLRPRELIIVDVFPRVTRTGFHGDMTRTFLKGAPSDAQRALVDAVRRAQLTALGGIRAGVDGLRLHGRVVEVFKALGYETRRTAEGAVGFFHGTGHGLGLDVHEAPSIGRAGTRLRRGAVVTVEPGLYYPGLGGCRIEDVVQVTSDRPRMLSRHPYAWVVD